MWRLQSVKVFMNQRLTEAVEEVIGRLEKAITEYEEEMESRHRSLMEMVSKPQDQDRQTADLQQQLVIKEVFSEQQEWILNQDHKNAEHSHIKEEKQDFWSSQEVMSQHEGDVMKFPRVHVSVKSEEEEEEQPQSSPLHQLQPQRQTWENEEPEPPASSSAGQIKTEADGEDHQRPTPAKIQVSDFKCRSGSDEKSSRSSEARDNLKQIRKPQTDLNTPAPVNNAAIKLFNCSKCGKRFGQKHHLQTHMRCHTGERPFSCSLCGKRFTQKGNLTQHLTVHTREKPCNCPVCGERFSQKGNLTQHMTVHTREKLSDCAVIRFE